MSTLADRSPRKSGRDFRRAREARTKFWRVIVVSAFFTVVLGANAFIGVAVLVKAAGTNEAQTAAALRIGRVTFPMLDGVFCRHVLFDNNTAQTKEDKVSRCDDRDSRSRRRTSTFNWGGR
jgi:hypothetical protein